MGRTLDFDNCDEHKKLINRIEREDIVLFLGSGFSIGALSKRKNSDGEHIGLPGVVKLKEILCDEMLTQTDMDSTLKEICEDCQDENREQYANLMRNIFSVKEISGFQREYARVNWKRIYSFNVDDVIEIAYDELDRDINIVSTEKPVKTEPQIPSYFKLHGDVRTNPGDITFSTSDYSKSAARRNDYRFEELMHDLETENFLFVGVSFNEEWDFDIRCNRADLYRVENKAFFVLKDIDERIERRIRRKFPNAVFIQETAENFIIEVMLELERRKKNCPDKEPAYKRYSLKKIVKEDYLQDTYLKPDLYLGFEPTWEDVFQNHDVIWNNTQTVIREGFGGKKIILIIGRMISGKSTLLYRLGANYSEDYTVLEYYGSDFLGDICNYEKDKARKTDKQEIILFDDANWILGKISELISYSERTGIRIIFSVREKEYLKKQHLFEECILEHVKRVDRIDQLQKEDIVLYLDKLKEKTFLGDYSREYERDKEQLAATIYRSSEKKNRHEDVLLSLILRKNSSGTAFKERINKVSNEIAESKNYHVKRFILLLYCLDAIGNTGLKLEVFFDLYPMKSKEQKDFLVELQDFTISNIKVERLKSYDYSKVIVHCRLQKIIENVIEKMSYEEIEEILIDILRQMDRVYHYKIRQSNSYYNYVVYSLMRSQNLTDLFKTKSNTLKWKYIKNIYDKLHTYYEDYHIYWLHRAIAEMKMGEYKSAEIHLCQARDTRKYHSYEIEHSFAMLYFEKAIRQDNLSQKERLAFFCSATSIIRTQIDNKENDAFSIHSFVVKSIEFYDRYEYQMPQSLLKEMVKYYYMAREKFNLEESTILRNMLFKLYQYLMKWNLFEKSGMRLKLEELKYLKGRNAIKKEEVDVLNLLV